MVCEVLRRIGWRRTDKQANMIGHHFQALNHHAQFARLVVQKFFQAFCNCTCNTLRRYLEHQTTWYCNM